MKKIAVIPARFAATRFPGKLMQKIGDKTVIRLVYENTLSMEIFDEVVVVTDNDAIVTAIDKVWVTIFGLGLVLATVFASLLITNIAILQEISLAVGAAIVIDVTVVIMFFVPALMGLAQKFNWWPYKISQNNKKEESTKTEANKEK